MKSVHDPYGGVGGGNAPRVGAVKPPAPGFGSVGGIVETGREFLGGVFSASAGRLAKDVLGGLRSYPTSNPSFEGGIEAGQSAVEREAQESALLGLDLSDRNTQIGLAVAGAAIGLLLWRAR